MNAQLLKALVALVLALVLFTASGLTLRLERTVSPLIQLIGAACLVIVALTHIFEALNLFPSMRWGQPNSFGHYLDLLSAVFGVTLVPTGYLLRWRRSRRLTCA